MNNLTAAFSRRLDAGFFPVLLLIGLAFCTRAWAVDLEREVTVDIPTQPLTSAVIEFAKQTGIQVVTDGADIANLSTLGVSGEYSIAKALELLLLGTGIEFKPVGETTVALVAKHAGAATQPGGGVGTVPVKPTDQVRKEELPAKPASESNVQELGTVVVTATKRKEAARLIPNSVTALRGEDLEQIGAQGLGDYLKLVPGVTFNQERSDNSQPVIRGIATDSQIGQTPGTVGIYINEVPFQDLFLPTSVPDINPFDLDRVEVLKGPQSTLFGSGAMAGAIRYITQEPEFNVWQSKLMGSYTDVAHGQMKPLGAGMLNIPLGQDAGVRLAGLYRLGPGVIDDLGRGLNDVDHLTQSSGRFLAKWLPTDRLNLNLMYFRQRTVLADVNIADQTHSLQRSDTPQAEPHKTAFYLGALTAGYDFGWATLLSSTSRKGKEILNDDNLNRVFGQGTGGTPNPQGGANGVGLEDQNMAQVRLHLHVHTQGILQDVRLISPESIGRWKWLGGFTFQRDQQHLLNIEPTPGVDESTPQTTQQFILLDAVATEKALYGDVTRALGDRWELTAGGRLFRTRLIADEFFTGVQLAAVTGQPESSGTDKVNARGFNPQVSLKFQINPDLMTYVRAAKGFQFGGVQILPASPVTTNLAANKNATGGFVPYDSSTLWNFETGARSDWFNHRVQFDATAFYIRWSKLQLTTQDANRVFSFVVNVGRAHAVGGEAGLRALLFSGVKLSSSAGLTRAVTDVPLTLAAGDVAKGTQLPGSAQLTLANVLSYDFPFSWFGSWRPRLSLTHTHTGRVFNDLQHTFKMNDYELLDAQLRIGRPDLPLQPELSLSVNNIFDKRAIGGFALRSRNVEDVFFIRPRTGIAQLTMRF